MTSPKRGRRLLLAQGQRIQKLRQDKGWNRTTLAAKAGVTVTTIRGCETGSKITHHEKLRAILAALGSSLKRFEDEDTEDPRVRAWTDEDYQVGNWYHHAPRQIKNWVWTLQSTPDALTALGDPQCVRLLEGWTTLTQEQKAFVLNSFNYIQQHPKTDDATGGVDGLAALAIAPKVRGPQR